MTARLERAYREAPRIWFDEGSRIVCMSDCHRGVGNHGDNFLPNQNVFFAALQYYYERNFWYAELGDGDELWENRSLKRIVEIHDDAYWLMGEFYRRGRLLMLYGNHDRKKERSRYFQEHCGKYYCDSRREYCELLEGLRVQEAVVLQERQRGREILLVHGHQDDLLNDRLWGLGRFLVRYLWRPLELLGVYDPTSAARSYRVRKRTESRLERWANDRRVLVIAGHTHRPVLSRPGESFYLNDGSCVHPRCITALELENGCVTLVKWSVRVCHGRSLSVERQILEGPVRVEDYWKEAD